MGLIIIIVLLIAIVSYCISTYFFITELRNRTLTTGLIITGIAISLILFTGTITSWIVVGQMNIFSPFIRIPAVLIIIPSAVFIIEWKNRRPEITRLMKILISSIMFSGTCIMLFGILILNFIKTLNIDVYH